MSTKTRSVTQYQVYILVNVLRKDKNNAGNEIERRELVAIFDDEVKLKAFVKEEGNIIEHDVLSQWEEIKPAASNYSLPFNPEVGEVEFTTAKSKKK